MKTSKERKVELKQLAVMPEEEIDTSDISEVASWAGAEVGKFYRPVKAQVTLRIDADVLAWFKARGGKYQTEINKALRKHMLSGTAEQSAKTAKSGQVCPVSGIWSPRTIPSSRVAVSKGQRMPPIDGKKVVWVLLNGAA